MQPAGASQYVLVILDQYAREQICDALNGIQAQVRVLHERPQEGTARILDLSTRDSLSLGRLADELRRDYRTPEVLYLLEEFARDQPNWQHNVRLNRQRADLQVLDAVLKSATPETISLLADGRPVPPTAVEPILYRFPTIANWYQGDALRLAEDVQRICIANALKVYLDRQEAPRGMSSVHAALMDHVVLRRKFFELLPADAYPVEINDVLNELRPTLPGEFQGRDNATLRKQFSEEQLETARAALQARRKKAIIDHMSATGLEDLLRSERLIQGPSKNRVYYVDFSLGEDAKLGAVVKVFDKRDPIHTQSKQNEFDRECRVIRYYERVGLLDPVDFTSGTEDGISIITMNSLSGGDDGSANLQDVLPKLDPDAQLALGKEAMRESARFHVRGPLSLARQSSPEKRADAFLDRIIGEKGYFLPNMIALFKSQGIMTVDWTAVSDSLRAGLSGPLAHLAATTEYDVPYCDVNFRNWFTRRKGDTIHISTKRDFGTIKAVPAPIDIVTPFVVPSPLYQHRVACYTEYFNAFNQEVPRVNAVVDLVFRDVRNALKAELIKDLRRAKDRRHPFPEAAFNNAHHYMRYSTHAEGFSFKNIRDKLISIITPHTGREFAEEYVCDLDLFITEMKRKRKSLPNGDLERFLDLCTIAETKRGHVMAGFFAEFALKHGLTEDTKKEILVSMTSGWSALLNLAELPQFRRKRDEMLRTGDVLRQLGEQVSSMSTL